MIELPKLRPYQEELVAELRKELARHKNVIACMPPGAGKTVTAKHILGAYLNRPKREGESGRAAFMVHRRGLVQNASDSFAEGPELPHGIIMSGCDTAPGRQLQVASIDTKLSWYVNNENYATDQTYDFLVFDEIHAQVQKFRTFLAAHNAKRESLGLSVPFVLGLSATPQHKELNKVFAKIVNGPTPSWLIENGFLSSFRYFQATKGKLGLLVKRGDDYTEESVASAMEGLAGDLVRDWKRLSEGRATIGFFPRRSQAQEAMELLRQNGVDAYYVDGETDDEERQRLFMHLNKGYIQYICNVGVIERGTDIPRVGCVQLCTAIGSVVRYRQMVGRGSRVHPEVSDCIVLDHANNINRHGFFEDDIDWTLEWGERPAKTHEPRATVECPSCGAIYRGGKCKHCGYEPSTKEHKSQGLEFVGGELREITKKDRKEPKKQTCEQIMITSLYRAAKAGGSFKQALFFAYDEAKKQGMRFRVPATVEVAGQRFRPIPYGHEDAKRRVREMYGFTVGNHAPEYNPYRVS
jgi:superfamily II DNA or RNA helicase